MEKLIKAYHSLLWSPATLGVMTHPDLWDDIHRSISVKVHRGEILSFDGDQVQLEDNSRIQADKVILATGWKITIRYFQAKTDSSMDCHPQRPSTPNLRLGGRHWRRKLIYRL